MKPIRWILILCAAAVVLTVVFIIVDKQAKDKQEKAEIGKGKTLWSVDSTTVSRITIDNEEGHFCFDWDDTLSTWKLTSSEQFNLNTYAVASVCNYLCSISTQKTVEFDCKDPTPYGFDHPVELKLYTGEGSVPYVIRVGDCTPTGDGFYAMTDTSNDVYTLDYTTGGILCVAKDTLKDLYIFNTTGSAVTYYKVEQEDGTLIELRRDSSRAWVMYSPVTMPTMKANVDNTMEIIVRATIEGFVETDPADLSKYGLDKPHTKITLTSDDANKRHTEIWLGDPVSDDPNETSIYGYYAQTKEVFRILKANVSFANQPATEYLIPYCYSPVLNDVRRVEIDLGTVCDVKTTLEIDEANGQYSIDGRDITAMNDEHMTTLFRSLYSACSTLSFSDLDANAVPPQTEPAMKITYTLADGSTQLLEFVPKAENDFYFLLNGSYTGTTIRLNRFTTQAGILPSYDSLMYDLANK